jgi:HSP20 family protein
MKNLLKVEEGISVFDHDTSFTSSIEDFIDNHFLCAPLVNIVEELNKYTIEIPVPGISKRDINIRIEDRMMWITGQRIQKKKIFQSELEYNSYNFHRSLALPYDADLNSIAASCKDGLLKIVVRKIEKTSRRVIAIEGSEESSSAKFQKWVNKLNLRNFFKLR